MEIPNDLIRRAVEKLLDRAREHRDSAISTPDKLYDCTLALRDLHQQIAIEFEALNLKTNATLYRDRAQDLMSITLEIANAYELRYGDDDTAAGRDGTIQNEQSSHS